ncbi:hypothetical protein [Herbaspirillum sp. RV1423]|uniref:hypothetical protein n=1 Tax=Herbaspirillum sp. RV1423 TaxID=1443993 RepID=UPI000553C9C7|nr:hypothetical protein [Herbaspirillum sp. RV1423]
MQQTSRNSGDARAYPTPSLQSEAVLQSALTSVDSISFPKPPQQVGHVSPKEALELFCIDNFLVKIAPPSSSAHAGPAQLVLDIAPRPDSELIAKVLLAARRNNLRRKAEATALRKYGCELTSLEQRFIVPAPITNYEVNTTALAQAIKRCYPRTTFTTRILRAFADTNSPDCEGQ